MSSPRASREHGSLYLPQYGFGPTLDFVDLVGCNQFLFRVYTPKERSPFFDDTEPFFIAPKFDERYRNVTPGGLKDWELDGRTAVANGTYQDVAKHMTWTTRSSSPYISTSFSPIWSIWEAVRRYHHGVKQDVEIAIIDAHAVSDRAITAVSLLSKASSRERHESHWKWFRFSQESQAVLIHGAIPGTAVLASVPLASLLGKLPSYFLKPCANDSNAFHNLAWDHTERKPNFRLFCRDISSRFLRLTSEDRLKDATTGSVELASEFLRPWFHRTVAGNSELATLKLCTLAYIIAQWPSQWWIVEHPKIWNLSSGMVDAIAGELHEKGKAKDTTHLQEAVEELEHSLSVYEDELRYAQHQAAKYHRIASSLKEKRDPGTPRRSKIGAYLPTPDASPDRRMVERTRNSVPDSPSFADRNACSRSLLPLLSALASSATAGTSTDPPMSPNRNTVDPAQIPLPPSPVLAEGDQFTDPAQISLPPPLLAGGDPFTSPAQIPLPPSPLLVEGDPFKSPAPLLPAFPITPLSSPKRKYAPLFIELRKQRPSGGIVASPSLSISPVNLSASTDDVKDDDDDATVLATPSEEDAEDASFLLLTSSQATLGETPSTEAKEEAKGEVRANVKEDVKEAKQVDATTAVQVDIDAAAELDGVDSLDGYEWIFEDEIEPSSSVIQKMPVFVETASYIATGFLVGALITLCVFSSHRRTILMNLT